MSGDLMNLRAAWTAAADAHNQAQAAALILARELGENHAATRRARTLVAGASQLVEATRRLATGQSG